MITANFTSATDNSGQTGRYPISIEVLNLLQEQSLFVSKTFGAMFGRNNLILKVPTETEDGLCLWEGELIPIDHRASYYPSGGGIDYEIAFQNTEIPNFEEDIEVGGETFTNARQMRKAFIYSLDAYNDALDFENSEEGQRVGAFFDGDDGFGICTFSDTQGSTKEQYNNDFLDVTEFLENIPKILAHSQKDEEYRWTEVDKKITKLQKTDDAFNDNWTAYETENKERFGLLYALILNLYKSLRNQIGAGFDQYLDSKYQETYHSAILPEIQTKKYFEELRRNAEHI